MAFMEHFIANKGDLRRSAQFHFHARRCERHIACQMISRATDPATAARNPQALIPVAPEDANLPNSQPLVHAPAIPIRISVGIIFIRRLTITLTTKPAVMPNKIQPIMLI
jgi:hypothetical protein